MRISRWEIEVGEQLPPFCYGYSYRDCCSNVTYFHLVPFNYLVRLFLYIQYQWNMFRSMPTRIDIEIGKGLKKEKARLLEIYTIEVEKKAIELVKKALRKPPLGPKPDWVKNEQRRSPCQQDTKKNETS